MNSATFRAIHKYGAILSVVGSDIAVIAYLVSGPDSIIVRFVGWAGPLCGFYRDTRRVPRGLPPR
jgi:hypothetical protein